MYVCNIVVKGRIGLHGAELEYFVEQLGDNRGKGNGAKQSWERSSSLGILPGTMQEEGPLFEDRF